MTYIICMRKDNTPKTSTLALRLTDDEKMKIESNAATLGFHNVSDYIRMVALNATVDVKLK